MYKARKEAEFKARAVVAIWLVGCAVSFATLPPADAAFLAVITFVACIVLLLAEVL